MNEWITHVKKYRSVHKCTYTEALKGASASYRSKAITPRKKTQTPGNPWLSHVHKYRAANPGITYTEALKGAAKTYRSYQRDEWIKVRASQYRLIDQNGTMKLFRDSATAYCYPKCQEVKEDGGIRFSEEELIRYMNKNEKRNVDIVGSKTGAFRAINRMFPSNVSDQVIILKITNGSGSKAQKFTFSKDVSYHGPNRSDVTCHKWEVRDLKGNEKLEFEDVEQVYVPG